MSEEPLYPPCNVAVSYERGSPAANTSEHQFARHQGEHDIARPSTTSGTLHAPPSLQRVFVPAGLDNSLGGGGGLKGGEGALTSVKPGYIVLPVVHRARLLGGGGELRQRLVPPNR
jgi:hypothetical protein